jgi:hypothetical protein
MLKSYRQNMTGAQRELRAQNAVTFGGILDRDKQEKK